MDSRKNLPSASMMQRLALCPGSWGLAWGLQSRDTAASDMGTRIHAALANSMMACGLNEFEHDTYDRCREFHLEWLKAVGLETTQSELDKMGIREKRLWMVDEDGDQVMSGQADWFLFAGNTAFICDYKTGFGGAPRAEENYQLHALACLVAQANPTVKKVYTAIIAPHAGGITAAVYDEEQLHTAQLAIDIVLEEIYAPDARFWVGDEQCKYCPAITKCPEARKRAETALQWVTKRPDVVPTAEQIDQAVAKADANELSLLLRKVGAVEGLIDRVKLEAVERLKAGEQVPFFRLMPGRKRRKIVHGERLIGRLASVLNLSIPDTVGMLNISLSDVRNAISKRLRPTNSHLEDIVESITEGLIEESEEEQRLTQVSHE